MNKKTWGIASIAIILILLLVGVSSFKQKGGAEVKDVITAVHRTGETEVPVNPTRVVVFDFGILDALDYLGVDVVGVAKDSLPEYLSKFKDEKYESIGTLKEPSMEKIYELNPDLIIISGRQADYYDELNKIAPTINLGVDSVDYFGSFTTNMKLLGEIFNKENEVEIALDNIEKALSELNTAVTEKGFNALVTLSNNGELSVYSENSRFGIVHQSFGFVPVDSTIEDSTHGVKASFEYVAETNPDYIFVVDRSAVAGGTGDTAAQELFNNEIIKRTDAYKNNRIVYLDAEVWYTSTGGIVSTEKMINEVMSSIQ